MAGFPQLREVGWLYGPDDPTLPLAVVRLFEHKDGSGRWDIVVADPAAAPDDEPVPYGDEQAARAELARLYVEGEQRGRWRIRQPDGY